MVHVEKNIKKRFRLSYSKYVYIVVYTVSILLLSILTVFKTHAETLKYFFQNLVQLETIVEQEDVSDLSLVKYELHWDTFENVIPLDTEATKISLHFLVSSDVTNPDMSTDEFVASSTVTNLVEEQSVAEVGTTISIETDTALEVIENTENVPFEVTSTLELNETLVASLDSTVESVVVDITQVAEENVIPTLNVETESVTVNENQTELFSDTFQVESSVDETVPVDVYISEVLPLEVISNETPVLTTQNAETIPFFEVLYSIDTVTWYSLGEGDLVTTQNMSFDLPQVVIGDISNIEVVILYTTTEMIQKKIRFSQMRLEVECALPEVLVDPLPYTPPIDLEPNFEVSAIQADAQSENIRAVLLERGGMLELWYGVLQSATQEVIWHQLASDGSLSATTPLQVHERTIFWLDKNQQTLFGFSVDEQSLFGDSFVGDDGNNLALQFSSKNSVLWSVYYNPVSNTFEFKREK